MARILAVDDSPDQLLALELQLRSVGHEVETALDGANALARCAEAEFDLILLDVRMPDIDGFEVSRRLKNSHRSACTPVIFLSGHLPSESARREAGELGAVDFVQKPFDKDELLARIQLMLRLQDVRRRLLVENAQLGRDLDSAVRALAEARKGLDELRQLQALDQPIRAGLVLVDAGQRVVAADALARALVPALAPGLAVRQIGDGGDALATLVAARAGGCDLGPDRAVRCEVDDLGDGWLALRLIDARSTTALRQRMRGREPVTWPSMEGSATAAASRYRLGEFIGATSSVRAVEGMVDRLRRCRTTVLIQGATGTGKELIARALHFDGTSPNRPFIPLHCGAITRDLIESELFGFEKGAFTGAGQRHDGLFAAADGGTIFLDEIAETSLELQVKLLRVLQRGEIRPVGSTQHRLVDVRIVAATHRDLRQLVQQGRFREDLYHRLGVVTVHLPALRERLDDLPALLEHFLRRGNDRHERGARPVRGVSRAAMRHLLDYDWPGNVRELENVIERAFALGIGELLQEEDLPPAIRTSRSEPEFVLPAAAPRGSLDLRARRAGAERAAFEQALTDANGDKRAAAQALGLPRSTFYRRLRDLGF